MKKILFLLFALITLQYNAAQSLYERKNVGNDIYVFTQDTTIKTQTCKKTSEYPPNCSRLTQQDLIIRELEEKRRSWADS